MDVADSDMDNNASNAIVRILLEIRRLLHRKGARACFSKSLAHNSACDVNAISATLFASIKHTKKDMKDIEAKSMVARAFMAHPLIRGRTNALCRDYSLSVHHMAGWYFDGYFLLLSRDSCTFCALYVYHIFNFTLRSLWITSTCSPQNSIVSAIACSQAPLPVTLLVKSQYMLQGKLTIAVLEGT